MPNCARMNQDLPKAMPPGGHLRPFAATEAWFMPLLQCTEKSNSFRNVPKIKESVPADSHSTPLACYGRHFFRPDEGHEGEGRDVDKVVETGFLSTSVCWFRV